MPYELPEERKCPDRGARPGEAHKGRCCEQGQCAACGGRLMGCGHAYPKRDAVPWSGIPFGVAECVEFGLFARLNPDGPGWVPCEPGHPDAQPDLNTLVTSPEFRWDRVTHRYVRA